MKHTYKEKIFAGINCLLLAIIAFTTIYPFLYVIAISLSSNHAITTNMVVLFPVEATLDSYKMLIGDGKLIGAFKNTIVITVFGTILNMLFTIVAGYVLSRKRLVGRKVVMGMIIFTMMFGGGLIPNFVLIKLLGIMGTYQSLWLLNLVSVYNIIIMINFFAGIPESLEEAGRIDGAGDLFILIRIMVPLSMPAIATLTLFYAVGWWNDYFTAMIYITNPTKQPMTVILMQMINNATTDMLRSGQGVNRNAATVTSEGLKSASIIVSTVPILCLYPFLQKYFIKGVMVGSVKG